MDNSKFQPDYNNIIAAARNIMPRRPPIYEHSISDSIMEKILNRKFSGLRWGNRQDKKEYFKNVCSFFKKMGYDTVSFEWSASTPMPGSGALGRHIPGVIKDRADFEKYPWSQIPDDYFKIHSEELDIMREVLPDGMKLIGGVGYGVFECVEDLVGYMDLCYISADDPELYDDLFKAIGKVLKQIWSTLLTRYSDLFAVCRFGDDLGFRSSTLISAEDVRSKVIPQYKEIIDVVHSFGKPFLLHSCGQIFDVMEDIINIAKIDAKHSNEDAIAPFSEWVDRYGSRIGNFGGIDTDMLCRENPQAIQDKVFEVMSYCSNKGGFALGSGNSIPDYVPVEGFLAMLEAARKFRGE